MSYFLSILAFIITVSSALPALAADGPARLPNPIIGVIDVQRILQESLAAKSIQKQLESQRAKFQSETESEENSLRQAEEELGKSRDHIASNVYSDREQALRQRFLSVERHVEARRKVLDQAFTDSMNAVRSALLEIVDGVAHAHGANLILVKQQALWIDKPLDVTDEVLDKLNKKIPQLAVKIAPEDKSKE